MFQNGLDRKYAIFVIVPLYVITRQYASIDSLEKKCLKYAGKRFELPLMAIFTLTWVTLRCKCHFYQPKFKRSINPLSLYQSGDDFS